MAWHRYQDSLCSCGHPRDQVWTEDADDEWVGEAHTCRVCAAADRGRDAYLKPKPGVEIRTAGVKHVAVRRHD